MPKIPCSHVGYKGPCQSMSLTGVCGKHKKRGLKAPRVCNNCDRVTQSKSGCCSHCSSGQMSYYQRKKVSRTMTEDQRLRFLSEMFVACGKLDLSIHNMR